MSDQTWLDAYNVAWKSASLNAGESMPCGGHDVGMNVWVEDGDLLFYFDRSGNFDENNQALKCGRARLQFSPNPFSDNQPFHQELKLREGHVEILAGNQEVRVKLWVDVFSGTIHADIDSDQPVEVQASYENWRTEPRFIAKEKRHPCMSYIGYQGDVHTWPDTIGFEGDDVVFYHRNQNDRLVREKVIEQQKLEPVADRIPDTQKDRTFGGLMRGDGMRPAGTSTGKYLNIPFKAHTIKTSNPVTKQRVVWVLHTAQEPSQEAWYLALREKSAGFPAEQAPSMTWWTEFWERSHIRLEPDAGPNDPAWQVGRNYQLFRYMLGCNAYGEYPSKFNGSLFTMDPRYATAGEGELYHGHGGANFDDDTPDYRAWGGGSFTSQNQRLVYWPLLKSGDFDMMHPQFRFFERALPAATARVEHYWGHGGCCFTEQLENFGLPAGQCYGWEDDPNQNHQRKPNLGIDDGTEAGKWVRYYYDSQLEWSFMILRYQAFTGGDISAWFSFIKQSVQFFDEHTRMRCKEATGQEFEADGKYRFAPIKSLETYMDAVNPLPVMAALQAVLPAMINLAAQDSVFASAEESAHWADMLTRLPDLPTREHEGRTIFSPAETFDPAPINQEDPQLYGVFPYPLSQPGTPNFQIARDTWNYDPLAKHFKVCWGQSEIWAAKLRETEQARYLIVDKLRDAKRRFPAFWGPGPDWVPDVDHGGAGMIGLQEMLIDSDGEKICLFPAWPKDWDADFKLHAPKNTFIECTVKDGIVTRLEVTPKTRRQDIELADGFSYAKTNQSTRTPTK